jgi:IS605 OrfB family transposase
MAWVNHNISKQIVTSGAGVFVMEDLTYIRTRNRNSWVHRWAFRQLQNFIDYKAIREGCRVVYVNPAYTSQECCICHNTNTVRHRSFVLCLDCGHSLNSDLNASRNIAQRYMRNMCMASVTMPIVSDYDGKASYDELRWSSGTNAHTL